MGLGWGEKLNLGGEETIHAIDMEDLEGNVNRAGAEKKFQAVFFISNSSFSLSKKNSVANSNDTVAYIVKISYKQLYSGTYLKKKTLAYAITQWLLRLYIHNELKTKNTA